MSESHKELVNKISIEEEMQRSYIDYAMSVIVSRALPDVRDGLKPVHRRVLVSMYELGYYHNKQHRKSARVVGDTNGKYHPHGEVAVYDSLVRMVQDFSLRLPLADGQGNFGSIDGDAPAAMRYTEVRLAKAAHNLLDDLDKETVDFQPNYDGFETEPKVLPAKFPNLLVNGASGIAVGMATNIPPHNLGEVIDACCMYIDNSEITIPELMSVLPGPDFPTAGKIMGSGGIFSAYNTGRGKVIVRGVTEIENDGSKEAIIITELPFMVNKANLVEKIADLVNEKKIEGVSALRDESDKSGIRVVIELKRDSNADVILNQLYSYTSLQMSFNIMMLALNQGMPTIMNLKEMITCFVNFREEVITKRTIFLLNKARDRAHILVGLIIAVSNIDEIVKIIKSASDPASARQGLMSLAWSVGEMWELIKLIDDRAILGEKGYCFLTEVQAKAILEMRLQRLTAMEKSKIADELNSLSVEIKEYLEVLGSKDKLLQIMKEELLKIKQEFGTPRRTEITNEEIDTDIELLIPREDMVVTVTLGGYIKRVQLSTYRAQKRGGKGRSGLSMRTEDVTTHVFVENTHTQMLFFSNIGQVYSLKVYELPLGTPQTKGKPMVNILPLQAGERITNVMPMPESDEEINEMNIIFATSSGKIRRNNLSDFKRIAYNGKIAIRLDENDNLVAVKSCKEDDHIFLATKKGKAIRCPVSSVRVFKSRTSDGVRGMKFTKDEVISMTILKSMDYSLEDRENYLKVSVKDRIALMKGEKVNVKAIESVGLPYDKVVKMAENEEFILAVSNKGYGKLTSSYSYRVTDRGGSGITNMMISAKTGDVVTALSAFPNDDIMLITSSGQLIRCGLSNVRITGRSTSGVILFKTDSEKVVSVAVIKDNENEDSIEEEGVA